jgi:hypothetical protein
MRATGTVGTAGTAAITADGMGQLKVYAAGAQPPRRFSILDGPKPIPFVAWTDANQSITWKPFSKCPRRAGRPLRATAAAVRSRRRSS